MEVSVLCLGTMTFGWTADEPTSFRILSTALERGIDFLDTADIYSRWSSASHAGKTEEILGRWFAEDRSRRDRVVLATKVRGEMSSDPAVQGLSRRHVERSIEDSLRRLQTDRVDLYQSHWFDDAVTQEETLRTYHPPHHRCELAGVVNGREFINDSKATNIHAMESALRGMTSKVVLIAGGKDKHLDYGPLRPLIQAQTTHVFTIGEIGKALAECWAADSECHACASLEEAVRGAYAAAKPGQVILFAPGTSSFDMFTGYDHRGNVFTQLVQQLTTSS